MCSLHVVKTRLAPLLVGAVLAFASHTRAQLPPSAGPFVDGGLKDGVHFEEQPLAGTAFPNLRATLDIEAPAALVLEQLFGTGAFNEAAKGISSREILVSEPTRRVYYETAEAPLISTRDYVLEVKKEMDERINLYALQFRTIPWPSRPERSARVRITIVGSTVVTPLSGVRCRVVQTVYSNPNGSIPAWVAAGAQKGTVVDSLTSIKKKAEAAHLAKGR